jgi:protein gp37
MGDVTGIAWTDHTFNPWIGCQKVSEGCVNCYAERENARFGWVEDGWKGRLRLTGSDNWKKPIRWAADALKSGQMRRIFCASLSDVFDERASDLWRDRLWTVIEQTGEVSPNNIEWLLLTKREYNIVKMLPHRWLDNPPPFIRLGVTTENQKRADQRIPVLLQAWHGKNFVSLEPLLGPVSLGGILGDTIPTMSYRPWLDPVAYTPALDWVIVGAESGPGARPMEEDWARLARDITKRADRAFFLKQMWIDGQLVKLPPLDGKVWAEFPV